MRDGLAVRAERGGVSLAITDVLLLDPVLGVRRTSIGIADGRVVAVGRAGNPDTMDAIDVVLDTSTAVVDGRGLVATPGGIDAHVHWLSPQICDAALAGGLTTLVMQDFGPVWNLGNNPAEGLRATWAALEAHPLNVCLLVARLVRAPGPGRGGAARRRRRAQDPRGRRRGPRAAALRARPRRRARRAAGRPHRRHERAALRRGHARRRPPGARGTPTTSRASAAGTGPTRSRSPGASASSPHRRRRPCRSASTRPRSTSRWCRRCTCSRRGACTATRRSCAIACAPRRWPRRGCCTTSA